MHFTSDLAVVFPRKSAGTLLLTANRFYAIVNVFEPWALGLVACSTCYITVSMKQFTHFIGSAHLGERSKGPRVPRLKVRASIGTPALTPTPTQPTSLRGLTTRPNLPSTAQVAAEALARVPAEPSEGDPEALRVAMRMPDGTRVTRRFRRAEPVRVLFDFGAAHVPEVAAGRRWVRTGGPVGGLHKVA